MIQKMMCKVGLVVIRRMVSQGRRLEVIPKIVSQGRRLEVIRRMVSERRRLGVIRRRSEVMTHWRTLKA